MNLNLPFIDLTYSHLFNEFSSIELHLSKLQVNITNGRSINVQEQKTSGNARERDREGEREREIYSLSI